MSATECHSRCPGLASFRYGLACRTVRNGSLVPLFAVLIYQLPISGQSGFGWLVSRGPVVLLGEASYALYLLHSPLLEWFGALLRPMPWIRERLPEPWLFVVSLTLAIGASVLATCSSTGRRSSSLGRRSTPDELELRTRTTKWPVLVEVSSV